MGRDEDDGCRHTGTERVAKYLVKKAGFAVLIGICPPAGVALSLLDDASEVIG